MIARLLIVLMALLSPVYALALDCPGPKRSHLGSWIESQLAGNNSFAFADFEGAFPISGTGDSDFLPVLLKLRVTKAWSRTELQNVIGDEGIVHVKFLLWLDGPLTTKTLFDVAQWKKTGMPKMWLLRGSPTQENVFGTMVALMHSDSCAVMSMPEYLGLDIIAGELNGHVDAYVPEAVRPVPPK